MIVNTQEECRVSHKLINLPKFITYRKKSQQSSPYGLLIIPYFSSCLCYLMTKFLLFHLERPHTELCGQDLIISLFQYTAPAKDSKTLNWFTIWMTSLFRILLETNYMSHFGPLFHNTYCQSTGWRRTSWMDQSKLNTCQKNSIEDIGVSYFCLLQNLLSISK